MNRDHKLSTRRHALGAIGALVTLPHLAGA
ncbi:MAG: hypothetical protein RI949_1667, partial [Pseudomonadota bacterium]